jgi:hypothetical protein
LRFQNISPYEIKTQNITLKKIDWKSYYLPAISNFLGAQSRTIQIFRTKPIILGNISIQITKSVNKNEIEIGKDILVNIKVENNGSLCIKNLRLIDIISFSPSDFLLLEGNLVNNIECLNPGDNITFTYKLQSKRQTYTELESAKITYYFLYEIEAKSNTIGIKIIMPQYLQFFFILIPMFIALVILGSYIYKFKVYHAKNLEIKRKEISILNLTSEDSIINIEHTLRERLNRLSDSNLDFKIDKNKEGDKT